MERPLPSGTHEEESDEAAATTKEKTERCWQTPLLKAESESKGTKYGGTKQEKYWLGKMSFLTWKRLEITSKTAAITHQSEILGKVNNLSRILKNTNTVRAPN